MISGTAMDGDGPSTHRIARIELTKATDRGEHDSSIALTDFLGDADSMTEAEFAAQHGSYFLVRSMFDGLLTAPAPLGSTSWRKQTRIAIAARSHPRPFAGRNRPDTYYAYPLVARRGGPLTIGRAHTCDVCVSDMSVSTLHAEVEVAAADVTITDRGSTNGTIVSGQTVDFGESARPDDGNEVQLGSVRLTFMSAKKFVAFVLAMSGSTG